MGDDVFHRNIVYFFKVILDVMFSHLHWHMELDHIRGLRVPGLDEFHEEVGQKHPQLGVSNLIYGIPEKMGSCNAANEECHDEETSLTDF